MYGIVFGVLVYVVKVSKIGVCFLKNLGYSVGKVMYINKYIKECSVIRL